MTTAFKLFLVERETCEALGIGRSLLRRMMAEGRINGTHIGRRLVFGLRSGSCGGDFSDFCQVKSGLARVCQVNNHLCKGGFGPSAER